MMATETQPGNEMGTETETETETETGGGAETGLRAKKIRLFLGVELSVATTRRIADAVARMRRAAEEKALRVAWVAPTNLHVTLKFLGWSNPEVVVAIRDVVRVGTSRRKAFELRARGTGGFPHERGARVLWVGVEDPSGGLTRLAADVETWMERLGYPREERPYHPHVTVGRVKEGKGTDEILALARDTDFGTSLIREVILYESVMKSSGSEYIPLVRFPLDAGAPRPERQTRGVEESSTNSEEPENHG